MSGVIRWQFETRVWCDESSSSSGMKNSTVAFAFALFGAGSAPAGDTQSRHAAIAATTYRWPRIGVSLCIRPAARFQLAAGH